MVTFVAVARDDDVDHAIDTTEIGQNDGNLG